MAAEQSAVPAAGTKADRCLQAALAEQGLTATPVQFGRWRRARLLDSPERPGAGRGKGRPSVRYPDAAVAQATTIIELLKLGVPLKEMGLAMFVRGAPIGVEPVRQALHVILAAGDESWLTEEAAEDRADALVEHGLRRARRIPWLRHLTSRLRMLRNEAPAGLSDDASTRCLSDMLTAVVYAITTESDPSSVAVETTAQVYGLDATEISAVFARMQQLSPHTLSEVAATVTLAELHNAKCRLEESIRKSPDYDQKPNFRAVGVILLGLATVARMEQTESLSDTE